MCRDERSRQGRLQPEAASINYETRRGDAATGSDVFTHLPRLFGYHAETPLTPAWRFDRCYGSLLCAMFRVLHWSRTIRSSHFDIQFEAYEW
jgi:hypothetical protein